MGETIDDQPYYTKFAIYEREKTPNNIIGLYLRDTNNIIWNSSGTKAANAIVIPAIYVSDKTSAIILSKYDEDNQMDTIEFFARFKRMFSSNIRKLTYNNEPSLLSSICVNAA
jgi:hypothetical protein